MTEEEIEKKAEDWYKNTVKINEWNEKGVCTTYIPNATTGFIAGAKLMQEDINKLLDVINNQDVKIADLEQQIEKMKCCYNCKHSRTEYKHCLTEKLEKWEIKENDKTTRK